MISRLVLLLLAFGSPTAFAWAENSVASAELVGAVMKSSTTEARVHRSGDAQWALRVQVDWTIEFVSEDKISATYIVTTYIRGDAKKGVPEGGNLITLGKPAEAHNRGGGEYVWTFDEGVLTLVRSYQSGAQKLIFAITRSGTGFDCTASVSWFREVGAPQIMFRAMNGIWTEMVSSKQEKSSCAIEGGADRAH
jgi:hypothetical protein